MQLLRVMFEGNNLGSAGKLCRRPGNEKEQVQFIAGLTPAGWDDLFAVDGEYREKHTGAGKTLGTGETALYTLLALLSEMLPEGETGAEQGKAATLLNRLTTGWLVAEDPIDQTGRDLFETAGKMQMSHALPALLRNAPDGIAQNTDLKPAGSLNPNMAVIAATGQNVIDNPLNVDTMFDTVNSAEQAGQAQVVPNKADLKATPAKSTGGETAPVARGSEQLLFLRLAEAIRGQVAKDWPETTFARIQWQPENTGRPAGGPVYRDGNLITGFNAAGDSARQLWQQYLGLVDFEPAPAQASGTTLPDPYLTVPAPAGKPTAAGGDAAGTTPPAIEDSDAWNTVDSLVEHLSMMLREQVKSPGVKTSTGVVQTQPFPGQTATGSDTGTGSVDVKTPAGQFTLKGAATAENISGETNSPSNTGAVLEASSNAQRAAQAQVVPNNVDIAATITNSTGGEKAPAVRGIEQPLFLQLAEAIRGQVAKDDQGRTHIRLQLKPESLGEVIVRLVYKDGNLSTYFHAATESARHIIESSLGQLRETLAAHNLNLQQSTVTAGDDQGRWAHESYREQQFNRSSRQPGDGRGEREEIIPEPVMDTLKTSYPKSVNHFV